MPVDPNTHLRKVVKVIRGARHQLFARLCDGLSAILRFRSRQRLHVTRNQVTELAKQSGAFRRWPPGPSRKCRLRRSHRGRYLRFASGGHFRQHLLSRRIDRLEVTPTWNRFAVDEVVDFHA